VLQLRGGGDSWETVYSEWTYAISSASVYASLVQEAVLAFVEFVGAGPVELVETVPLRFQEVDLPVAGRVAGFPHLVHQLLVPQDRRTRQRLMAQ
jgi:hypothetical protein